MFSMNLCDQISKDTLRAFCFNEKMFPNFKPSKSYEITSFKVKKAFSEADSVELLLDGEVSVNSAAAEIPVFGCMNMKIHDILTPGDKPSRLINLFAKVMTIHEPVEVGAFPNVKTKKEITLADETGHIDLVLWRQRAERINFETGDVLSLQNVVLSTFNDKTTVTTSFESTINVADDEIAVKEDAKSLNRKIELPSTTVLAVKNYQSVLKCFLCKSSFKPKESSVQSLMTSCPTCNASFLTKLAGSTNQCSVMLSDQTWYTARTSVSKR